MKAIQCILGFFVVNYIKQKLKLEESQIKLLLYQLLIVFLVWLGLLTFVDELVEPAKFVFYLLTSWLLFLLVLVGKNFFSQRKK